MKVKSINEVFKRRKGKILGDYKEFAVMILIYRENKEEYIILEKRALTLRKQPGDICLPGGKIENNETPLEGAIRESCEELNIERKDIEYVGEMDYLVTPYGSIMHVFVSYVNSYPNNFNKDEVHSLMKIPLKYFLNNEPQVYTMNIGPLNYDEFPFHLIEGGKDYKFSAGTLNQYFYSYKESNIWGFTARIIKSFIDYIKENDIE